jgi:TPR repeat protein
MIATPLLTARSTSRRTCRDFHWLDALTPPLEQHLGRLVEAVNRLLASECVRAGRDESTASIERVVPRKGEWNIRAALQADAEQKRREHTEAARMAEQEAAHLRQRAEQGDATAQTNLGVMYSKGRGVEKS